jgi:isoquinoline 1-oxidoreductase beta subunit
MTTKKTDQTPPNPTDLNRREFLTTTATVVGGAMVLGFWMPPAKAAAQTAAAFPAYRDPLVPEINAWLTIAPDDTVTIRVGQTECGNGVFTSCPMIVAEELQCDWKKVRAEYASAHRNATEKAPAWTIPVPGNGLHDPAGGGEPVQLQGEDGVYRRMGTYSSGSVREGRYYLQLAGAEARERLLLAAATEWGVPVASLVAKDGIITHAASKRRINYGAMAAKAARAPLPDPAKTVKLKTPDQYWLMGTEQKSLDTPLKITGQAQFGNDVRLPGMLYAAAKSCPVWGGDVKSYAFNAIRNRPGVHSVVQFKPSGRLSGGVAVVADTWWRAKTALDAMPLEWAPGPNANVTSASLLQAHMGFLKEKGTVRTNEGDIDKAMGRGAKIIEATYTVPYVTHANFEPCNATAIVTADRLDIWTSSQYPNSVLQFASEESGLPAEKVFVHTMFLGGGYGVSNGAGHNSVPHRAVAIAKTLNGRPVQLLWTREEDWGSGAAYRPMGIGVFKAAVDAAGWPIAVEVHSTGEDYGGDQQWRGLTAFPYYVPDYRYTSYLARTHVPADTRRATGSSTNAFYVESFIDELAHNAGKDPYLYRRELIARNPTAKPGVGGFTVRQRNDWLKALDMVAKMSGWGTPLPEGWTRSLVIDDRRRPSRNSTTVVGWVGTVEVTKRGQVRLHRVDVVFDTGFSLVNPLTVRKQIEGQIAWGWSDAMYQAGTIKDGRVLETNFDSYPVSRMNEYPRQVNIQFMKTDHWLYGLGEESIQHVAPAIANAVFRVTGKRIRSLPLKDHDLSWG